MNFSDGRKYIEQMDFEEIFSESPNQLLSYFLIASFSEFFPYFFLFCFFTPPTTALAEWVLKKYSCFLKNTGCFFLIFF